MGPIKDVPSVNASGEPLSRLPDGVTFRPAPTQVDERGSVCELYDLRWLWHPDPLVFVYMFTLRPGMIKGWGLHKLHEDRYFVIEGEMQIVMYDVRPGSSTQNTISQIVLSQHNRGLLNIPAGIWHANRNLGNKDAIVINFPTRPYQHDDPDKYRLPLDTDQIPYKFEDLRGW
jgi:dTDP-4-dehydrorhamnose 3,5-epimerase